VGGGQGELAERIVSELNASLTFVDISPRMVELAQGRGLDARVGDVQELPFEDGSFDTVVAAWMLYHVPDLDRALAEIARVLVPGGALLAVTVGEGHLAELRDLLGYDIGIRETFTRENGEEHLSRHFPAVERYDADVRVDVTDRARLVAYRDSISVPTDPVPDDLELPFVVHGQTSIFFATT
jgi:SAM-dependent methyltransferase